jgi:hypothetical protein
MSINAAGLEVGGFGMVVVFDPDDRCAVRWAFPVSCLIA